MNRQRWSLSYELATLEAAVEGARMLVDLVANDQAQDEHDAMHAPGAASAVMTLVNLRIRDIGRLLRGEMDPDMLRGAHNEGRRIRGELKPNREAGRYPSVAWRSEGCGRSYWNEVHVGQQGGRQHMGGGYRRSNRPETT